MQPLPALVADGEIVVTASNASQSRGAHGAFRYFGKLPPDVTGAVLDAALGLVTGKGRVSVLDPMCGSGSTLLEAHERGANPTGFDVNPVAILYARVKTRSIDVARALALGDWAAQQALSTEASTEPFFGLMRNADRWFTSEAQQAIAGIMTAINALDDSRERDFLKAAMLSRLRRISNASARTGRIFYDPESAASARTEFLKAIQDIAPRLPTADIPCEIHLRDARLPAPDNKYNVIFLHPPYFALYRYSSDVLRFEMEVGGYSRRTTARMEVADGWKSGDPRNLDHHVADMRDVFKSAQAMLASGGAIALVTSNSTLGDHQLPVVDRLVAAARDLGLGVARHLVRPAHFGSATYHRSARTDKVIQQDHVVILRNQS